MAAILTVLRSGGEYKPEHVYRLAKQCRPHGFLCLTDVPLDVPYFPLMHDWPGWWAKIELFRLSGPILYMDLDTTIVGDLEPFLEAVEEHEFIMLRPFAERRKGWASGLMGWSGDLSEIYRNFLTDPTGNMNRCRTFNNWGDQGFISNNTPVEPVAWQDVLPGKVVSYKKDGMKEDASIVCFHGNPRPWEIEE